MRVMIAAPVLGLLMLGACSQPQYILSEGQTASTVTTEGVVHGAQPVYGEGLRTVTLDSDNQSVVKRTGLNSDPYNPSGMPARPKNWYEI
jgi:hypothetical protein